MNKFYFSLLITVLCTTYLHNFSFAQSEAGAIFLTFKPGSRANAMGGAQVAIADDIFASYYNPAGLATAKRAMAGFFQTDIWLNEQTHTYWGGVVNTKFGSFGFSLNNFSMLLNFDGIVSAQIEESYERGFQFSYAHRANKNLLFGVSVKFIRQKWSYFTNNVFANAITFDLGIIHNNLIPRLTLFNRSQNRHELMRKLDRDRPLGFSWGIVLQNTGPSKLEYIDASQQDPLPQMLRLGMAYHAIDYDYFQFLIAFDVVKELVKRHKNGETDNFMKAWFTSWDDGLDYVHFGAEMTLFRVAAFRVGREKILNLYRDRSEKEVTFGFGIGPEFARVNLVHRGFPPWDDPSWVLDFSISY